MDEFVEIIKRWPSNATIARDLGIRDDMVSKWKLRNYIPPEYWAELLLSAPKHGIYLSGDELIAAARRQK